MRKHQWLDHLCDKICEQVAAYMAKKQHSYQEFVLEDKLKKVRTDNKFLQLQLTKTRADLYELQQRPQKLRDTISEVLLMTEGQLKNASRFPVRKSEKHFLAFPPRRRKAVICLLNECIQRCGG